MQKKFLLFLIIIFISQPSYGLQMCRCVKGGITVEEQYHRAYAVFVGTVTKIKRRIRPNNYRVTFDVLQSWKGAKHKHITIYTSAKDLYTLITNGVTCGYKFKRGTTYLVYSYRDRNKRGLSYVTKCGGTKRFTQTENGLKFLADDLEILDEPEYIFKDIPFVKEEHQKIEKVCGDNGDK